MQKIVSPHDKLFKLSMQERRVAEAFFKRHLPVAIQELLQFDTLHLESESFIDQDQQDHFSDVLYSVVINERPGYLFVLAEHQSSPDRFMPFRVWHYMCLIWDKHLKTYDCLVHATSCQPFYRLLTNRFWGEETVGGYVALEWLAKFEACHPEVVNAYKEMRYSYR